MTARDKETAADCATFEQEQEQDVPSDCRPPKETTTSAAVFSSVIRSFYGRQRVKEENIRYIFFPWSKSYQTWWGFTVFCSVFTIFYETYQIAFGYTRSYPYDDAGSIIGYLVIAVFILDMLVHFNLAFYNDRDEIIYHRRLIAKNYLRLWFWVDMIGVFPFFLVALAITGNIGVESTFVQYLSLLRLLRLVRLYRVKQLFAILQTATEISLLTLTLTRNFGFVLLWTHFNACIMYFIARQFSFDPDQTWIGQKRVEGLTEFERYTTSMYWSVVTFTTVGYGDYSPVNSREQIWGMIYMLLNILIGSWIIGSMTLLVVKNDQTTGLYRDTLHTLKQYSDINSFDSNFHKTLDTQLKLDFNNREIADEQVLKHFPSSVRRKVLRRLYLPSLMRTSLMKGIRQQFIDDFLTTCHVEIFSPGEEILQRGNTSSDLYLLVGGIVALGYATTTESDEEDSAVEHQLLEAGDFINEISFFTESPIVDTIRTVSVCKTLTMPRSLYKMLQEDHPGSSGKILANLLAKVVQLEEQEGNKNPDGSTTSRPLTVNLPKRLELLRAGSMFDDSETNGKAAAPVQQSDGALTAVRDIVQMHIDKQKDDLTTRFLFAASRGDTPTISLMCDQGFDPSSADYDSRTALMVAAMKGNNETVAKLLYYQADPNMVDIHGSSALYEAARNGHEYTMDELLKNGAELCMSESLSASSLCQAVHDGEMLLLKRLLKANINVNAADYDKRTADHLAAAEGNVAALKILFKFGVDLTVKDRWNNSVEDEAKTAKAVQFLECLREYAGKASSIP
jgi:ankyrin repeat protein